MEEIEKKTKRHNFYLWGRVAVQHQVVVVYKLQGADSNLTLWFTTGATISNSQPKPTSGLLCSVSMLPPLFSLGELET